MQLIRRFWDAAVRLDLAAAPLDEGTRFTGCAPGPLQELFSGAGLADVVTGSIDVPTVFTDFDDHWTPFPGGTGPAPAHVASLAVPTGWRCGRPCGSGCRPRTTAAST
jgi:hypothetical protein